MCLNEASASEVIADASISNNYLFRGLTQTNDQAAVQGGVQYHHSGFSAGLKISNVDFRPGAGPQRKPVYTDNENIYFLSYGRNLGIGAYEVGATSYEYPSGVGSRFHEFNGGILYNDYRFFLNYDSEHENLYSELDYEADINNTLSWRFHIAYYQFDDPRALRKMPKFDDYGDILIGIRRKLSNGFVWGIDFTETDLDTD